MPESLNSGLYMFFVLVSFTVQKDEGCDTTGAKDDSRSYFSRGIITARRLHQYLSLPVCHNPGDRFPSSQVVPPFTFDPVPISHLPPHTDSIVANQSKHHHERVTVCPRFSLFTPRALLAANQLFSRLRACAIQRAARRRRSSGRRSQSRRGRPARRRVRTRR